MWRWTTRANFSTSETRKLANIFLVFASPCVFILSLFLLKSWQKNNRKISDVIKTGFRILKKREVNLQDLVKQFFQVKLLQKGPRGELRFWWKFVFRNSNKILRFFFSRFSSLFSWGFEKKGQKIRAENVGKDKKSMGNKKNGIWSIHL